MQTLRIIFFFFFLKKKNDLQKQIKDGDCITVRIWFKMFKDTGSQETDITKRQITCSNYGRCMLWNHAIELLVNIIMRTGRIRLLTTSNKYHWAFWIRRWYNVYHRTRYVPAGNARYSKYQNFGGLICLFRSLGE